jgi:hypothetical protein
MSEILYTCLKAGGAIVLIAIVTEMVMRAGTGTEIPTVLRGGSLVWKSRYRQPRLLVGWRQTGGPALKCHQVLRFLAFLAIAVALLAGIDESLILLRAIPRLSTRPADFPTAPLSWATGCVPAPPR